jgi:hypothetical protein
VKDAVKFSTTEKPSSGLATKKTCSESKIAANQRNSRKSTGPRTITGKMRSRRNALKHGLFARDCLDFFMQGEDADDYKDLLNGLRDYYRPIGTAEQVEVEWIAVCLWKRKRAWRFQNVMNRVALRNNRSEELSRLEEASERRGTEKNSQFLCCSKPCRNWRLMVAKSRKK